MLPVVLAMLLTATHSPQSPPPVAASVTPRGRSGCRPLGERPPYFKGMTLVLEEDGRVPPADRAAPWW
jgi:hypothetical protein